MDQVDVIENIQGTENYDDAFYAIRDFLSKQQNS